MYFPQPDPNKCRAVGVGLESAEKHQFSTFKVEVVDTEGNPCTGSHNITVELKSRVDESITTGSVVSKTPAIHDITYQPRRSGEHEISVRVNGMHINSSPFVVLVQSIPHPKSCKAVGEHVTSAMQNSTAKFMVQLADAQGEPCVSKQEVVVELKCLVDGSVTTASVVSKTPPTYEVSYQPSRSGEHELSVKVNGMEISGSPFVLLVHNIPHSSKCKAVGEGIIKAEKYKSSNFIVQLADAEGDPCVTKQEVAVELQSLMDASITKGSVVSKTPATYEVSYQPSRSGEHELSVKVNGMEINGSPFALLVHNIPHPQRCKAVGEGITEAEKFKCSKFMVQLADADGDPCLTKQEIIAELKSKVDGSCTKVNVVSKTPATYEATYRPNMAGEHALTVKVNGEAIQGSPFTVTVTWDPELVRVIDGLHDPRGIAMGSDGVIVVIEEGGLSLLSKDGQRIKTIGSDIPRPTAVAVDGNGNIYTVSSGNVFKLNYDGEVKGDYLQQKYRNFGIAVSQHNVFFGGTQEIQPDTISRVILVFDTDLKLCTSFGISSSSPLACDSAGNLCVINPTGTEVEVFFPNGTRLRSIMLSKTPVLSSQSVMVSLLFGANHMHVDYNHCIYVTYIKIFFSFSSGILVFNKAGSFVTSFRHSYSPCGITTDEDGFMYICNSEKGCIEVFH